MGAAAEPDARRRPTRNSSTKSPLGRCHYTPREVYGWKSWPQRREPIRVALVDDYDVVLMGVATDVRPLPRPGPGLRDRRQRRRRGQGRRRPVRLVRPARERPRRDQVPDRPPARAARRRLHLELPSRPDRQRPARRGPAATCPRRCPPGSWSPRSKPCTPARR